MAVEDYIAAKINSEAAALREKAEKIRGEMLAILKAPLPDQIVTIGDAADVAVEKIIGKVNTKELRQWRTRAIKIEAVNKILATFEKEVAEALVRNPGAITVRAYHQAIALPEFLLNHIASLSALLGSVIGLTIRPAARAGRGVLEAALASLELVAAQFSRLVDGGKAAREAQADLERASASVNKELATIIKVISMIVASGVLIAGAKAGIAAFSAAKLKDAALPISAAKLKALDALKSAAFPQGSGRVRRRKEHRIRARR